MSAWLVRCFVLLILSVAFTCGAQESKAQESDEKKKTTDEKQVSDWGDWNKKPTLKSGVGISGDVEHQLSLLDKSNLIKDSNGVAVKKPSTQPKDLNVKQVKKPKDIKQMMAELEALEKEVEQDLDDNSEF